MELRLKAVDFRKVEGDRAVFLENNDTWIGVLLPLLVDVPAAKAITGGFICSSGCLNEEGDKLHKNYRFVDRSRF